MDQDFVYERAEAKMACHVRQVFLAGVQEYDRLTELALTLESTLMPGSEVAPLKRKISRAKASSQAVPKPEPVPLPTPMLLPTPTHSGQVTPPLPEPTPTPAAPVVETERMQKNKKDIARIACGNGTLGHMPYKLPF
ncbi:hypothetical protein L596_014094 [Steinernema carpocapsae]|uniref:Uncharacterized protein n=1 Tax=Steinernema carpocapsae TaxID=34508 RepID=A0A4U5NAX1_STECR|nr:hypothetical protein L596_014094 [Steinernema carpocapsae]